MRVGILGLRAHHGRVQRRKQTPMVSAAEIPTLAKKRKDGSASAVVIPESHRGRVRQRRKIQTRAALARWPREHPTPIRPKLNPATVWDHPKKRVS
jgi:hypothetical protein